MHVTVLRRGTAWLDTPARLTHFTRPAAACGPWRLAATEESAWRMGYIDDGELIIAADRLEKSGCRAYLQALIAGC